MLVIVVIVIVLLLLCSLISLPGGVHLLRYGTLHGSVLGLEIVQANGAILDLDSHLRKDNTGFDLKQLFIGSEGSLGVITRVTLAVPPLPKSRVVALLSCDSFAKVRTILRVAKEELGEVLSAFEMMDRSTVSMTLNHCPGTQNPLPDRADGLLHPFYVLVEVAGSNATHDEQKLSSFTERVVGDGTATDGTIGQDITQVHIVILLFQKFSIF
jgi:D-2-hydroxyglutarate dehydrogenase